MTAQYGTNQTEMRQANERLVLSVVRHHKALSKAEIARLTGLSAQTVSVIMRGLEQNGLLQRGTPIRKGVGQPSVPMSLAPDGAFFLGLKIGRRSCEMVLVDFRGHILDRCQQRHIWPSPSAALDFAADAGTALVTTLPAPAQARVAGVGIATPFRLWDWADSLGAPRTPLDAWRTCDLRAEVAQRLSYPVYLQNDATAACGAELTFGTSPLPASFVYVYVGFFIGGGIVLNGQLRTGPHGNAGALGSIPVRAPDGRTVQLIDCASIAVLERAIVARGLSPDLLWADAAHWPVDADLLDPWIDTAAQAIAQAAMASVAVLDVEAVVLDGWMPPVVRRRLTAQTQAAFARLDLSGLELPRLIEGTLGPDARTLGAAALPLADRYLSGYRPA